jgi:hypothetical protein
VDEEEKGKMKVLAILLVLISGSFAAIEGQWKFLTYVPYKLSVYADTTSISRNGDTVEMRLWFHLKDPENGKKQFTNDPYEYNSIVTKHMVNCADASDSAIHETRYLNDVAVDDFELNEPRKTPTDSNSVLGVMFKYGCTASNGMAK